MYDQEKDFEGEHVNPKVRLVTETLEKKSILGKRSIIAENGGNSNK